MDDELGDPDPTPDATPDPDPALPVDPDLAPVPAPPSVAAPGRAGVLAVIAVGGMLGSSARYGMARWLPVEPGHFPWATFWTNLSGSFVLGVVLALLVERFPAVGATRSGRYLRPFVATGIIGAYTTMSTYVVETALLLKDGHPATAVVYAVGSLFAGLALAYGGIRVGRPGS